MKKTKKKMGRPPPIWFLQMHNDRFISIDGNYTRKQLAEHYEKHVTTIEEVIEKSYEKLYEKKFPIKKIDDGKNIIALYPGKILKKLSQEYSEHLDCNNRIDEV